MIALLFLLTLVNASQSKQSMVLCNLCKDAVGNIENLLETKGADYVRTHIDEFCPKGDSLLETVCNMILNFGIDEIIKYLNNNWSPLQVCEAMGACE
jgi:hypothetical protein